MNKYSIEKLIYRFVGMYQTSLGVYQSREKIYVVALRKKITSIEDLKTKVFELNSQDLLNVLPLILKEFNFNNIILNMNVNIPGSFFKVLRIPQMPLDEISSWLKENLSQILKISLSLEKSNFSYNIINETENIILFAGFIQKKHIEQIYEVKKNSDFILNYISPGMNDIFLTKESTPSIINSVYIIKDDNHELILYRDQKLIYYNQVQPAIHKAINDKNLLINMMKQLFEEDFKQLDFSPKEKDIKWLDYTKADENEYFTAAKALALKPFFPKRHTFGFSKENDKTYEDFFWKQLFFKCTIICGGFLSLVYLIVFLVSFIFALLNENTLEKIDELQPKLIEVNRLKHTKKVLENDLQEAKKIKSYRSNCTVILDAIACHIPKNCWLIEIKYEAETDNPYNTYITGISRDRLKINELLNNMEEDKNLKEVNLEYIKSISAKELYKKWKVNSSKYLEFRINFIN